MGLFIFIIILGTILGAVSLLVYFRVKSTDTAYIEVKNSKTAETCQDFLPFKDISDSMIDMGNHSYRAIIDCGSVNYQLKTDGEKEVIEASFQRFVNSLSHPVTFFIQTTKIDYSKISENYLSDVSKTLQEFPALSKYAEEHHNFILNSPAYGGVEKQKKKYIIVPFDEAAELTFADDREKREYVMKELFLRCQILIEGLQSIGITSKILNTREIAELLYSTHNKEESEFAESISSGEYLSLMVEGDNKIQGMNSDAKFDWILAETVTRIKEDIISKPETYDRMKTDAMSAIEEIEKIREKFAGYFKTEYEEGVDINGFEIK